MDTRALALSDVLLHRARRKLTLLPSFKHCLSHNSDTFTPIDCSMVAPYSPKSRP